MGDFDARTRLIENAERKRQKGFFMLINVAGIDPEGPFFGVPARDDQQGFLISIWSPRWI